MSVSARSHVSISLDAKPILYCNADNNLYAINPDGTEKWRFTTGDDVFSSPAINSEGTIYVGSLDNNLYAINSAGTEQWRFPTGNDIHSSPAIALDGTIYVGSWGKGSERQNYRCERLRNKKAEGDEDG